jgi:cation diffusion facilitator family transporter
MSDMSGSLKSIFYALAANTAIAIAKGVAAFITGSGSMFAEAIHSCADAGNQVLLLYGLKQAKKPPSTDFPLGYGKEIYFWSFIVAVMLFSIGGLVSIYEGVHKLQHPEPLNQAWIAVAVLVFAVLAEGGSLYGCVREINKVRGEQTLWQWFRSSRQSELIVIFGEDLAALLGLLAALVAVSATMITGDPLWDALGSCVIGGLLIVVAILLAGEVKELLIGQGVEPRLLAEMTEFITAQQEVETVFNLLTLQMGNDVLVAVKAQLTYATDTDAAAHMINAVEARFRERFPQVTWLFFEPDVAD